MIAAVDCIKLRHVILHFVCLMIQSRGNLINIRISYYCDCVCSLSNSTTGRSISVYLNSLKSGSAAELFEISYPTQRDITWSVEINDFQSNKSDVQFCEQHIYETGFDGLILVMWFVSCVANDPRIFCYSGAAFSMWSSSYPIIDVTWILSLAFID